MSAPDLTTTQQRTGKALQLALVGASLAWAVSSRLLSASSAQGIANRLNADWAVPLLSSLFLLFLLAVGFSLLQLISHGPASTRFVLGLPKRPTALREWLTGVAIGWGMVTFAVLPMALAGDLHVSFWHQPRAFLLLLLNLAVIAAGSLVVEVIFRGYPFRRLIDAIGPIASTLAMSVLYALTQVFLNGATRTAILVSIFSGIVFSIAWLRTHGLWLAWGMRFAWIAGMGVLFGLPVGSSVDYSTIIQTVTTGSTWLTGGDYGPEASLVILFALLAGLVVLILVTRDYAWSYTHPAIVPAGYPMDIAPPAAHTAMEEAAQTKTPTLVQILPTPPQGRSAENDPNL